MFVRLGPLLAVTAAGLFCASPALAAQAVPRIPEKPRIEQSKLLERRCEVIIPTGSRLAKKKVCATEAEWKDYQLQDRQATEKIQMGPCVSRAGC